MSDVIIPRKWNSLLLGLGVISISTLILESSARHSVNYQNSLIRPSILLTISAVKSQVFFKWLGFQLGKFTDVFYIICEYLADDLANIVRPATKLGFSWLKFFQGYYDYFTSGLTWTTWQLGTIGTTGVIVGAGFLLRHYTGVPKMTWVTGSYRWLRGYQGSPVVY